MLSLIGTSPTHHLPTICTALTPAPSLPACSLPTQDPGLFALAMCAALGDAPTKKAALEALPRVCRTATTLFTFLSMLKVGGKGVWYLSHVSW